MKFSNSVAAAENNTYSCKYLTKNLEDYEVGQATFNELLEKLGNTIDMYPRWHPIVAAPAHNNDYRYTNLHSLNTYIRPSLSYFPLLQYNLC